MTNKNLSKSEFSLSFPESFINSFNNKANKILSCLNVLPSIAIRKNNVKFSDSHLVKYNINEKDVISVRSLPSVDGFGEEIGWHFKTPEGNVGLQQGNFQEFLSLVEKLAERKEIRNLISQKFIKNVFFEWLEKRYKKEFESEFIEYFIQRADEEVKDRKISILINFLIIERSFKIGKITFEFLTEKFFDDWEEDFKKDTKISAKIGSNFFKELRKRYQGKVYASIKVKGDKETCKRIAKEETEIALMSLRFFSPTVFIPEVPSYFGIKGKTSVPSMDFLIFEGQFPNIEYGLEENRIFDFRLDKVLFNKMKKMGLDNLSDLLLKDKKTKLEELLLNSLFLFSKAIISNNFEDKLVFSLVPVEMLLLKDTSEPIQSNLWLRLSFLTANKAEERKKVKKIIQEAYKLRSAYLHHGKKKENFKILRDLQILTWTALRNILISRDVFAKKEELLEYIEDKILS